MSPPEPNFRYDSPGFLVEFTENKDTSEGSGKGSGKILEYIKNDSRITIPELAAKLSISTRSVEKHIDKLQKEKILKRVGGRKLGQWQIINDGK